MPTEAAFLFDLDGVLVDSAELVQEGWIRFAAARGIELSREQIRSQLFGRRTLDILQDTFGMSLEEAQRLVEDGVDDKTAALEAGAPLPEVPGAVVFVRNASRLGIRCAVVTSASRANAGMALNRIGLGDELRAVIDASMATAGKPDPDPYLQALRMLSARPERSIAFEDTAPGIRAAHQAGVKCVALTTSQSETQLREADLTIPDFRGVEPRWILSKLLSATDPL